jgi:LCP family protein required for cell wall assembly
MKELNQINQLAKKDLFDSSHSSLFKKQPAKNTKVIFILSVILLFGSLSIYSFFSDKSPDFEKTEKPVLSSLVFKKITSVKNFFIFDDFNTDQLNILALGRPGAGHPGENLTDTIIIFHFGSDQKLAVISLPRDLLVKIPASNISPARNTQASQPCFIRRCGQASQTDWPSDANEPKAQSYTKINQLYGMGGLEMIKQKTKEITGLSVDRYVLMDLTTVEELINFVDGVNVFVPQDIYDPLFPGPNYSYEAFALKAGWRYLDGETALKYTRTRYSKQGDFDRMKRQQQILLALKQKVLSFNPLFDLPVYLKIFQSFKEHVQTDLTLMEIKSLWQLGQKIEPSQIINLTIDKERTDLLTSGPIILNGQTASMVWPRAGQENYSEIKELIQRAIIE